jgi:DNA-binding NarL/FixJ family response regulator
LDSAGGSLEQEIRAIGPQVVVVGDRLQYEELRRIREMTPAPAILVVAENQAQLVGPLLMADGMSCVALAGSDGDLRKTARLAAVGKPTFLVARGPLVGGVDPSALTGLTDRELEVVQCLSAGLTNQEIAESLHISSGTARTHVSRIFDKLGLRSRREFIGMSVPQGAGGSAG